MPSAEQSIVATLEGAAGVTALAGTRIYSDVLPQNVTYPAIRYVRISTARAQFRVLSRTVQSKATRQEPRIQVDCYATTRGAANTLAAAVRAALDGFSGVAAGLAINRSYVEDEGAGLEPDAGDGQAAIYRTRLDFIVSHAE